MRPRSLRRARVVTGAMLLGAAGAVLAPAGPDALVPFKMLAAAAAQEVGIVVVVDFGNGTVTSNCVHVPAGSTDEQALAAVYPVVMNNTGLICDINSVPTTDTSQCLRSNGAGEFYYWSYFQGTSSNTWQYANVGPAESSNDVEGWVFQNPGPDNPSAPAPPMPSSNFIASCTTPTTTTTAPAPPPPTTAPPAVTPAAPNATTTVKGSTTSGGTSAPTAKGSSKSVHTTTTVKGSVKAGTTTTTTLAARGSTTGSAGSTKGTSDHREKTGTALASASVPRTGSGGAPILPLVLIGVVIALLAGFGYYRWRQRPAEE